MRSAGADHQRADLRPARLGQAATAHRAAFPMPPTCSMPPLHPRWAADDAERRHARICQRDRLRAEGPPRASSIAPSGFASRCRKTLSLARCGEDPRALEAGRSSSRAFSIRTTCGSALDCGVDGVMLGSHGGRQADWAVSALDILPRAREIVGDRIALYMSGGIRRGSDILKACALGADAVLAGRATLYGLCAHGEDGVRKRDRAAPVGDAERARPDTACPRLDDTLARPARCDTDAPAAPSSGGERPSSSSARFPPPGCRAACAGRRSARSLSITLA